MQGTTQPIDRQTLLEKANKLIREHEDTLAGIEATDVVQRNNVLVFSGECVPAAGAADQHALSPP
ncbi:DUF2498 family protein [Klebsiella pneumoniae subsp. pneumoniae]|nr:DUF2498 family protein [Klebsiella pneumoniae subsp. pneumoniae]